MQREELRALQTALVKQISGERHWQAAPSFSDVLTGVDPDRLALMSRLTQAKRMGKIARLMPATLACLASELPHLIHSFGLQHPLRSARSYPNAVQFYRFLRRLSRTGSIGPEYLVDLAKYEVSVAAVSQRPTPAQVSSVNAAEADEVWIHRSPSAVFCVLRHDIQPLLQSGTVFSVARRNVFLMIAADPSNKSVRVLEVASPVFDWVRSLQGQQIVRFQETGDEGRCLLTQLAEVGVLELRTAG
jgi:hypothetical protein